MDCCSWYSTLTWYPPNYPKCRHRTLVKFKVYPQRIDSAEWEREFYLNLRGSLSGSHSSTRRAPATNTNAKMSIVPMMFRDWWDRWDDWERPSRLLDQHFGAGLRKDDLLASLSSYPSSSLLRNSYFRPWRPTSLARQESSSTINMTKEKFEIMKARLRARADALRRRCAESAFTTSAYRDDTLPFWMEKVILDVQQFTPEEITVKAANNSVVVEGKHEERPDEHGFISRQFTRRYVLPGGYNVEDLVSTLSSDGVLTIAAPKRQPPASGERVVPVTRVGPAKQPEAPKEQPKEQPREQPREQNIYISQEQPREQNIPIVTSP